MAGLPTKEDLFKLGELKGREAVVWYAWRNALRSLLFLGKDPLESTWPENTVSNIYQVSRVSLLIHVLHSNKVTAYSAAAAYAASDASDAYVAAASDASSEANVANAAASSAGAAADFIYAANAVFDYDSAMQATTFRWTLEELWPADDSVNSTVLERRHQLEKALISNLNSLDLQFLANDIESLWRGEPLGDHAINYCKKLSENITNNPEKLRRAILIGDTTETIQQVRVLLLGSGGAGKSELADRLKGVGYEGKQKLATQGIDYQNHQPLPLKDLAKTFSALKALEFTDDLSLNLWDFGGQTIFHGLHSAFLHENCVYVLVVDSRHEQAPEEWLHQIQHLAGARAKVFLVTNYYEGCVAQQNETRLIREFPDLLTKDSFFYFSCINPDNVAIDQFVHSLLKSCADSRHGVLEETLEVKRAIDKKLDGKVFLHESEIEKACKAVIEDFHSLEGVMGDLIQLGFLVEVKRGTDRYCIQPQWAVDKAYYLLNSQVLLSNHGKITVGEVAKQSISIFNEDISVTDVEHLIQFIEQRSLCTESNGKYFFADAAPANEPAQATEVLLNKDTLTIYFDMPYFPLGIHARLVHGVLNIRQGITIEYLENPPNSESHTWRHGFILTARHESDVIATDESAPNCRAVVQYNLRRCRIEVVLEGDQKLFSHVLRLVHSKLLEFVTAGIGAKSSTLKIQPLVKQDNSTHTIPIWDSFLENFEKNSRKGLNIDAARDMSFTAGSKMTNETNVNIIGSGQANITTGQQATVQNNNYSTSTQLNAAQRGQLKDLVEELLKTKLEVDAKKAVWSLGSALNGDTEPHKAKNIISATWERLSKGVGFASDSIAVGEFVKEHHGSITAAITTAVAAIS